MTIQKLNIIGACIISLVFHLSMQAAETTPRTVPNSPTDVRPIVVGSAVPSELIQTSDGKEISLRDALGSGKKILVVYRGGWCPYCTKHFGAIGSMKDQLEKSGWELTALSPDNAQAVHAWTDKHGADGIRRFSDGDADALCALGLGFVLDAKTRTLYKKYKIDLEAASGFDHFILPVPAVLLIVDGTIRAVHADTDYTRRLRPELLSAMIASIEADDAEKKK